MTRDMDLPHKSGGCKVSVDIRTVNEDFKTFCLSDANSPALSGKVGVKRAGVAGTPQYTKVAKTGI